MLKAPRRVGRGSVTVGGEVSHFHGGGVGGRRRGLHCSASKAAVLHQVPQSLGRQSKYVTGGFALAEEYSAFVVGEFEAAGATYTGEGRLLPLHGQCRDLSEFSGEVMDE